MACAGPPRRRSMKPTACVWHRFFFSSRRRHTRFDCDWSSDVCSSDLALYADGVRRHAPVGRATLVELLAGARVMLYRGDPGETFCLALAEAQAMGVPAVVQPLGSVAERVVDGATGRVTPNDDEFAEAAVALLRDDELWQRYHRNS